MSETQAGRDYRTAVAFFHDLPEDSAQRALLLASLIGDVRHEERMRAAEKVEDFARALKDGAQDAERYRRYQKGTP